MEGGKAGMRIEVLSFSSFSSSDFRRRKTKGRKAKGERWKAIKRFRRKVVFPTSEGGRWNCG